MQNELSIGLGACIDTASHENTAVSHQELTSTKELESPASLGVVVIGRNEGDRLNRCLRSLQALADRLVYVDSGSTDDSVDMSRGLGVDVLELDLRTPFTAARARNEGFRRLMEAHPDLEYVFFVDGDCEVVRGWPQKALEFMGQHPETAVVWGRRREQNPRGSLYNLLCEIEWEDYPLGETTACGGDAVMRVAALREVNGFRSDLICGEEPEMCVRLRKAGWHIWHLADEMTLHDAALLRFSQWWKRMLRGGYAYAQGVALHGGPPERHWVTESRRAWIWGFLIPLGVLALTAVLGWWGLAALLIYPLQVARLAAGGKRVFRENWLRAGALVLSKFPEMLGQLKFILDRSRRVQSGLIEYK